MGYHVSRQAKTMMTRKITIMALIAGIVLGAAATEGFNFYRQSHDSQIFQERLRCKAVADAYIKKNNTGFLLPGKVDYSPARNSCVAGLDRMWIPNDRASTPTESVTIEDLLSGETLFSLTCTITCNAESMYIDSAFKYVMNNVSKPTALEKEASAR
jgi:hypothetical protein